MSLVTGLRLKELIHFCFIKIGHRSYISGQILFCETKMFSQTDITMLEFIDNVMFNECVSQHIVGSTMGTNSLPLLSYLFYYAYEADFLQ